MSTTLAPERDLTALQDRIALIACGERPGKTKSCDGCSRKSAALLNIASTGAADAVAAAICGTGNRAGCYDCTDKSVKIVRLYNGETV
ncbi:hypothetical protein ABTY59_32210 [Streptomyces sp. NPDC096079]|uniref:hypothetical protein n=1 Tax=Streptomyces sp. NPDC096079 TaxID=3155820 RepID=UPI00332925C6